MLAGDAVLARVRPGVFEGGLVEEEELFVGAFWLLDAAGGPGIENFWLHDWRLLEVAIVVARSFPRLFYFALVVEFAFVAESRDVRLPLDFFQLTKRCVRNLIQMLSSFCGQSVH